MRNTLVLITVLSVSAVIGLSACGTETALEDNGQESPQGGLTIQIVQGGGAGLIVPGGTITVLVASEEGPVERARVEVNGEDIGETDVNGLISVVVPSDDELIIKTVWGELGGELKIDLQEI